MRSWKNICRNYVLALVIIVIGASRISAQHVIVNTFTKLYQLTGGAGNCSMDTLHNECTPQFLDNPYSIAVFKDTLYYTDNGILRSFKIGVPGSCQTYANVGGYNSMTVDTNGILYLAGPDLETYNPYTNTLLHLGQLPFGSGGDLVFFNNKLLLAGTPPGIYEIDITNPAASTLYMGTNGIRFYGLISYPVPCKNSRYFGLASNGVTTTTYELDLANRKVIGTTCDLTGLIAIDAGSTTESGINQSISFNILQISHPCPPFLTGNIYVQASQQGSTISYTLDNTIANNTGIFNNVAVGNHTLKITGNNCSIDTPVNIIAGLNPAINIQAINPNDCNASNGVVVLNASSGHLPITYKLNNTGQQQTSGRFANLSAGTNDFTITDAIGCKKDTSITLIAQPARFILSVNAGNEHCLKSNGFIKINIAGGDTSDVLTSLSGGSFISRVSYNSLAAGSYDIRVKKGIVCFFDTTITINNVFDPIPSININTVNQLCFINNGSISINATLSSFLYTYGLNNSGLVNNNQFAGLAPGFYTIKISDQYGCQWDTSTTVLPYNKLGISHTVSVTNPLCTSPNSGSILVNINGAEGPYTIVANNSSYTNGQLITGLSTGNYNIKINNKDGCTVDSLVQKLEIIFEPYCNNVFVPSAFTPDGNGVNDVFRPVFSSFIKDIKMDLFNRYGQRIYEGEGPGMQWDGKLNGTNQPSGSYIYVIVYTDFFGTKQTIKGSLLLIR